MPFLNYYRKKAHRLSLFKLCRKIILATLLLLLSTTHTLYASGIDIVRNRLIEDAISGVRVDDAKVEQLLTTFVKTDSIWQGINYQDTSRVAFEHTLHLENMVTLARAYQSNQSAWYRSRDVWHVFDLSLNFWLAHDFLCENWWDNEIGTPTQMIAILYIMNDHLSPYQVAGFLKIAGRAHVNAWGARQSGDRIKMASLETKQHIFRQDATKASETLAIIEGEIAIRNRERGIQSDYSFHHRVDRVNNTVSYGLDYINAFAEWVRLVSDTEFQFSEEKLKIAIDYYLDGICKFMVFGRVVDTNARNREIVRGNKEGVMSVKTPAIFMAASSYRKEELENIVRARQGEPYTPTSYAKFYWETEHFVFQRPRYYTSVRMFSCRNASMEVPYNGEGLLNHYRADGTNYLSHSGGEHLEITPYNDWQKIPGTTVLQLGNAALSQEVQQNSKQGFVGGVCDGMYGAAVCDFRSPISDITAKKSWFFFDNEYVCLGADINSSSNHPLVTTIEQVKLAGDVTLKTDSKFTKQADNTQSCMDRLMWVHHNKVGYFFPEPQCVQVSNKEQVGSWRLINAQTTAPEADVKGDVFKIWLEHGEYVNKGCYSYIVFPYIELLDMEKVEEVDYIRIVRNDANVQAVMHEKQQLLYIVFYNEGRVAIDEENSVRVDHPCMLMVHYAKSGDLEALYLSDPYRVRERITIDIVAKNNHFKREARLPQGDFSGSTIEIPLVVNDTSAIR